jgi:pyruvate formate lyase activating enzyme
MTEAAVYKSAATYFLVSGVLDMRIYGFQKLTLLDYPEHLAALVFSGGCNFRCPWCHNGALIRPSSDMPWLDEADVLSQLERRASMLEGVVISGGEPTLQPDLKDFILKCRDMGYKIKLDTNGSHPEVLIALVEDGLVDYVAMDIKADKENYGMVVGLEEIDIESIEKSIRFLIDAGGTVQRDFHYEFRTTVMPQYHDPASIAAIAGWIQGAENYFLQAFRDSDAVPDHSFTEPDSAYMQELLAAAKALIPHASIRGV